MSLYIHKENQELLWSLIHQSPQWNEFEQSMQGKTTGWFKNILSMFYESQWELCHSSDISSKMSIPELTELNKKTIMHMLADIKRTLSPAHAFSNSNVLPSFPSDTVLDTQPFDLASRMAMYERPANPTPLPKSDFKDELAAKYQAVQQEYNVDAEKQAKIKHAEDQFAAFQAQYNLGFERKAPTPVDFSVPIQEGKIGNMKELVQKQLEEREKEMQMFTPPLQALGAASVLPSSSI